MSLFSPIKHPLRGARILYTAIWILAAAFFVLTYCVNDAQISGQPLTAYARYIMQVVLIALSVGGAWTALRLFTLPPVHRLLKQGNAQTLARWNALRTGLLGVAVATDGTFLLLTHGDDTPLYCLLIALAALIFCWPKA